MKSKSTSSMNSAQYRPSLSAISVLRFFVKLLLSIFVQVYNLSIVTPGCDYRAMLAQSAVMRQ